MADTTTEPQVYKHNALQRVEASELNDISNLAADLDAEAGWATQSASNCVIDGFHIAHLSGVDFEVSSGSALYGGQVLKGNELPDVSPDVNGDPNPRIDVVYIYGPKKTDGPTSPKTALGPYTQTTITSEALGTGDGVQKAFDLANSGVILDTLHVQLDSVQAGGWNLSRTTGAGGNDQVIFGEAPAPGVAVEANVYRYESGGAEAPQNVSTRQIIEPDIRIIKGTPAASPLIPTTPNPETDIVLTHLTIPGSWSGGPITTVDNSVKTFFLHPDQNVDSANPISPIPPQPAAPRAGRVASLLRNLDQLLTGARLRFSADDTVEVTAMWSSVAGHAIHTPLDTLSLQLVYSATKTQLNHITSTDWWYIYMYPQADAEPGTLPELAVSSAPPNSRRRDSGVQGGIYVGAVYVTSISPVTIRPFYTHGPWVMWEDSVVYPVVSDISATDTPITSSCPPCGRLCSVSVQIEGQAGVVGDSRSLWVESHKSTTTKDEPAVLAHLEPAQTARSVTVRNTGLVRAEEDAGIRYVHVTRTTNGSFTNANTQFKVLGYLDDYRTMDQNGAVPSPAPGY